MLVFGGTLVKDGVTTNDVYWITMDRMEWHLQPCKGEKPPPRWGVDWAASLSSAYVDMLRTSIIVHHLSPIRFNHCSVYDEENHRLVIFGGRNAERKRLNDVWFLDLDKW